MRNKYLLILCAWLFGCSTGPARWGEDTAARLQCGMSVEDAGRIAGRDIEKSEVPRGWSTHVIRGGRTELWLGFPEGKLRWVQVLWAQRMTRMAMYDRIDLCGR